MFDKLRQKAASVQGLPKDIILDVPLITILGKTEATLENFKGIIEYTDEVIRVKTTVGALTVRGSKLCLKQVTSEIINISGIINGVDYV